MKVAWRQWGVSWFAWLGVLGLGGMALAGSSEVVVPSASLSPAGAVEGKTLASGEPFEMTLHFEGTPETDHDLAVTYDGDGIGVCQADAATLTTNPQGKATFECDFSTVVNAGTEALAGTVTFTVSLLEQTVAEVVASLTVSPAEVEEPEELEEEELEPEVEEAEGANHGHCVSFWAHEAKAQGLSGRSKGAFVSSIAQNPDAVTEKGEPGEDCDFQAELDGALTAQVELDAARVEKKDAAKGKRGGPDRDDADDDEVDDA